MWNWRTNCHLHLFLMILKTETLLYISCESRQTFFACFLLYFRLKFASNKRRKAAALAPEKSRKWAGKFFDNLKKVPAISLKPTPIWDDLGYMGRGMGDRRDHRHRAYPTPESQKRAF